MEEPRQELPSSVLLRPRVHPAAPRDRCNAGRGLAPTETAKVAKLWKIIALIFFFNGFGAIYTSLCKTVLKPRTVSRFTQKQEGRSAKQRTFLI